MEGIVAQAPSRCQTQAGGRRRRRNIRRLLQAEDRALGLLREYEARALALLSRPPLPAS